MGTPYLSEIRIMSFNFAPKGWAFCNGQTLPINQNQALFSLLGTTYGGNGQTTFALPNLQGRTPMHEGGGHNLGEVGGEAQHTLSISETPTHNHGANASSSPGNQPVPANSVLASPLNQSYAAPAGGVVMDPSTVATTGGSQAHNNLQPFLALNFCIALQGAFPTRN
jgi:microcystin-dependent protein